jgi:hypothetical protein
MGIGSWLAQKWDDGVEIMAVAVSPIVTAIDSNDTLRYITGGGSAPPPANFQYMPEIYARAENQMRRGIQRREAVPGETPEQREERERFNRRQIQESSVASHRMNAEVQAATARYQDAAIDICTLPSFALCGPCTGVARGTGTLLARPAATAAARAFAPRLAARWGLEYGAPVLVDLGMHEAGSYTYNTYGGGGAHYNSIGENVMQLTRDEEGRRAHLDTAQVAEVNAALAQTALSGEQVNEERIARLYRNGRTILSVEDLDRNNDGVLSPSDAIEIRSILGDDELGRTIADRLFAQWESEGIRFNGLRYRAPDGMDGGDVQLSPERAEAEAALRRLSADGSPLSITDLDRDGDGVLTAADENEVRRLIGNESVANALIAQLREQGITFENMSLDSITGNPLGGEAPDEQYVGEQYASAGNNQQQGFFSRLWASIVAIFSGRPQTAENDNMEQFAGAGEAENKQPDMPVVAQSFAAANRNQVSYNLNS